MAMSDIYEEHNPQRVAEAALHGVFSITADWGLTREQQRKLLGDPPAETFNAWLITQSAERLDAGTLRRISYIFGIYKALRILLPTEQAANEWVAKPNAEPMFCGKSALSLLLSEGEPGLRSVRRYLDGQLYK